MNTSSIAFALTAALSGAAQAQATGRTVGKWFSISATTLPPTAEPGRPARGTFAGDELAAWTLAARYSLSGGTLQFGYGSQARDGLPAGRQLSIGYAWPLTQRTHWYADAIQPRTAGSARSFEIGVRSAW
jgi:hypothetical protein